VPKVSAVLITYNEECNLALSLPKLHWCDEIIVVDSGSDDATLNICKFYGCKIYHREFDGYGNQKRYAVQLATNDWILCLDADEVLSDKLVRELQTEMLNPAVDAYYIPMFLVFMNKRFRYGKESGRHFLRLFNKNKGGFNTNKVHEKIVMNGTCKKLLNCIDHYSYRSFSQYFNKFNRYTTYGAEMAFGYGKQKSVVAVVIALPLNFLKYYFVEKNFLNGLNGFYWSVLNSFYHFAKYIKIRELYKNEPADKMTDVLTECETVSAVLAPNFSPAYSLVD